MEKIKETYVVEGYLVDKFQNILTKEFREYTEATSFDEAERKVVFKIKTKRLNLPSNFPAKLKQIDGKHFTYRNARDV